MLLKKMNMGMIIVLAFSFFIVSNAQSKEPEKERIKIGMQPIEHKDNKIDRDKTTEKSWNKVCPVRGGEVDNEVAAVEYKGKNYGFCCGGCDAKFKKDPGKYSKNLSDDGKKFIGKKS